MTITCSGAKAALITETQIPRPAQRPGTGRRLLDSGSPVPIRARMGRNPLRVANIFGDMETEGLRPFTRYFRIVVVGAPEHQREKPVVIGYLPIHIAKTD